MAGLKDPHKIGVSKEVGIIDLYTADKKAQKFFDNAQSLYSIQEGNETIGGAIVVGNFANDVNDGLNDGVHSGKYGMRYIGERGTGHNEFEEFDRIQEKFGEPTKFYG